MAKDKIGMRLKALREERDISLEELSDRSGLTLGLLEALEQGEAAPALGSLVKITRVLGCRLGTMFDDIQSKDPHIVRRDDREKEFTLQLAAGGSNMQHYYSLGKGKSDRHMEPFYIELRPEPNSAPDMSSHEGEEFIMVLSGSVKLTYGKNTYVLEPGDTMYYNSIVPHHVGVNGNEKATIYAVVHVPF